MDMPYDIRTPYKKIDFHLPGNFTDDSIILDTLQLPIKNPDDLNWVSGTENESMHPNIQFTRQIKVWYYMKARKADCIEHWTNIYFWCQNL